MRLTQALTMHTQLPPHPRHTSSPMCVPQSRLVIWGSNKAVGGAEALVQLWKHATALGLSLHFLGTATGDLFATDMPGPPSPHFTSVYGTPGSLLMNLGELEAGDTVITRSDLPEGCYGVCRVGMRGGGYLPH
jgi:hypothetical protein